MLKRSVFLPLLLNAAATSAFSAARSVIVEDASQNASAPFDPLQYVNQLIGTDNGGNVFAGATLPYGMAKSVADVSGQDTGGFATDGTNITGFSHMHDSGTGGNPSLGNFPLFPYASCINDTLDGCTWTKYDRAVNYKNDSVKATPGYFSLTLENNIAAEMTTTMHAAIYHFKFPEPTHGEVDSPIMLMDLTDLNDSRQNATVSVNNSTGRIMANGTFLPSFGSGSFISYVCADFQGAAIRDTGIYVNSRAGTYPKEIFVTRGINEFYLQAGSFVRFHAPSSKNRTVTARVGVSLVSTEQACANAEREIPDWNFARVKSDAESAWRQRLGTVSVTPGQGVSKDWVTLFYSGIYRNMMSPQNYTGENPLWKSAEPYYDSFYCIWDAFRASMPLLTVVDPTAYSEMLRSLLDTYVHLGWLPDCRMSLCMGFTQGGSNADNMFSDAYLKKVPGVNWTLAYDALKNDAENEPLAWSVEGRGGLDSWHSLNYIPELDFDWKGFGTNSRSISRTLEYAYNDFCVSTLAKANNDTAGYEKYMKRAGNWKNIFKADQTSFINGTNTGFTGFFQPKYLNGTWGYQDPIECSPLVSFCSLTDNPQATFEDSIWEYQFFVPQDFAGLVTTLGGPNTFVSRLNYLHTSGLTDIGNEPSFLTVYQYHYAGRPGLSSYRAHSYIPSQFNDSTIGLPGNDDSGAMGAFTVWGLTGLFPNPGQSVYLIIPPFFESVSWTSPITNKTATIKNVNFDSDYQNIYIQSATLNGTNYTKNWISHDFFLQGGTLELTLGRNESATWGRADADLPPSISTTHHS